MMTTNVAEHEILSHDSIGRFMKSVKTLSLTKRKSWIAKMVDKDKIYLEQSDDANINNATASPLSVENRTPFKRSMFACIDALNTIFGNEWDMHIENYRFTEYDEEGNVVHRNRFMLTPIVHFEQVTIQNGRGLSRDLRNLFIALPMRANNIITVGDDGRNYMTLVPRTPYGLRTTFFSDEKRVGYVHSHLRATQVSQESQAFVFSKFCIGGGSELHDLIMEMEHTFAPGVFALFLVSLRTLAEWESIEGGPHIRMEKIGAYKATSVRESSMFKHFDKLIPSMMNGMNVNFVKHNDIFKIKRDEVFEAVIKHLLHAKGQSSGKEYFNFISKEIENNWESYDDASVAVSKKIVKDTHLIFNGRKYHYTELPTASENSNNSTHDLSTYRVYPKFLNYVADQLEQLILKASIRSRLSATANQSGDARVHTQ